jgi:hypothetical protein
MHITSTAFQQAFGITRDKARPEPVVVAKHDRDSLIAMPIQEWERLKRRKRCVGLASELSEEWVEAVRSARVSDEVAHLDAELK